MREHGVVERVVRIVLGGVVLADDGVDGQVEQQPHLLRFEKGGELFPDPAVGNDFPDDEEGSHAQAPADAADAAFARQMDARQVFPEIRIRHHEPVRVQLAYGHALRIGDPLPPVVCAVIFVVDVDVASDLLPGDEPGHVRNPDVHVQFHVLSLVAVNGVARSNYS